MQNKLQKKSVYWIGFTCLLLWLLWLMPNTAMAMEGAEMDILFTHDVHSHGEQYARLQTMFTDHKAQRPATLIVDGGDIAMGTLLQTIYSSHGAELRMMGALGYDAVTLGNHEFDYRTTGLISMLQAAKTSNEPLPALVLANIDHNTPGTEAAQLLQALDDFGRQDYIIIQREGIRVAIIGVLGLSARLDAPTCALDFIDPEHRVSTIVNTIKAEDAADMIICLSHSGTNADLDQSEDEQLALAVPELDLIISAHTHTTLEQPIVHGDTYIVSCGSYGTLLGSLTMTANQHGRWDLTRYELLPVDEQIPPDAAIAARMEQFTQQINTGYLAPFHYTADQVLANNPIAFPPVKDLTQRHIEQPLGNLIADAYRYSVSQAIGKDILVAIAPGGTIRATYPQGPLTVNHVFNSSSLGIGADQVPGYPLVSAYLTGAELMTIAEIDASLSDLMSAARLYNSGLAFTFNPHRLPLNKVTEITLSNQQGNLVQLEKDTLYPVTTDLYSCQMLSTVTDLSHGLLSIIPKYADGTPVEDIEGCIVYQDGQELKTWQAIAIYLQSLPIDDQGIPTIPDAYSQPQGRKIVNQDTDLISLVKHPNRYGLMYLALALVMLLLICLLLRTIYRRLHPNNQPRTP